MQLSLNDMNQSLEPPKYFKGVKDLKRVRLVEEPQFAKTGGAVRGPKRKGLLYQAQVVSQLEYLAKGRWEPIAGVWFELEDRYGKRFAQTDWMGIDYRKGHICLVEVKLSRVADAWWQLNKLYGPLVKKLFPDFAISYVEIASVMMNAQTPEEVKVVQKLEDAPVGKTSFMRIKYDARYR